MGFCRHRSRHSRGRWVGDGSHWPAVQLQQAGPTQSWRSDRGSRPGIARAGLGCACRSATLRLRSGQAKPKRRAQEERGMETYNIYMDEAPAAGDANGDEGWEVEFRVVGQSIDDGDPENNAVLAGLDLVDLINLRDALQQEIDNFALTALETHAMVGDSGEELMP